MNRISILAGLCLSSVTAWGQDTPAYSATDTETVFPRTLIDKEYWEWGGKVGGGPEGYEVGISRCNWRGLPFGMATVSLLNEFPRGVTWVNPKVSVEIGWLFLAARLSAVDYTNWNDHEVRMRPEYGFSVLGVITIMYHRDFMLSARRFDIPTQGWSVTLNWPSNPTKSIY